MTGDAKGRQAGRGAREVRVLTGYQQRSDAFDGLALARLAAAPGAGTGHLDGEGQLLEMEDPDMELCFFA